MVRTGVSASARQREHRVTWKPRDGVRLAAVVVSLRGATVAASLRDVESREEDALVVAGLAWLTCLVLTLAACAIVDVLRTCGYG